MKKHLLGTGVLNWNRSERVTDRYGSVMLTRAPMDNPISSNLGYTLLVTGGYVGKHGKLVAVVKINRMSPHIGDLLRGLHPPKEPIPVGKRLTLGCGTLFEEVNDEDGQCVGLQPDDERDSDWLDPKILYKLHNQTVDLFFVPDIRPE